MEDKHESKSNTGLHRVQAEKLQYHEEQEERSRSARVHQVLQVLQKAHRSQRNEIAVKICESQIRGFLAYAYRQFAPQIGRAKKGM